MRLILDLENIAPRKEQDVVSLNFGLQEVLPHAKKKLRSIEIMYGNCVGPPES